MPFSHTPLAAGSAFEMDAGYDLLDVNFLIARGSPDVQAYRIDGDSMVDEIQPGSVVFVDPNTVARSGDIIVAVINGKNCVKRLEVNRKGLYLVSSNDKYPPQRITDTDTLYIRGVVRGSLQLFER